MDRQITAVIHNRRCALAPKGDKAKKCDCWKFLYISGTRERRAAGTQSWQAALDKAAALRDELNGAVDAVSKPNVHLIQGSAESYIKVPKSFTEKAPDTWEKAERWVLDRMTPMLIKQDVIYLHQITADHLENWRTDWEEEYGD